LASLTHKNLADIFPFFVLGFRLDVVRLSKELMFTTLVNLGFTEVEVQVYVYLVTEGPQETGDIDQALKISRQRLHRTLKALKGKGAVKPAENETRFWAVPFAEVLELLAKVKKEQQKALQESKEELIATWQTVIKKANTRMIHALHLSETLKRKPISLVITMLPILILHKWQGFSQMSMALLGLEKSTMP